MVTVAGAFVFFGSGHFAVENLLYEVLFASLTVFCVGCLRSRIVLETDSVRVRNPFWSHRIDLAKIISVTPGYSGLIITTDDGRTVTAWAVQKSNWAKWRHVDTRADTVAATIRKARFRTTGRT